MNSRFLRFTLVPFAILAGGLFACNSDSLPSNGSGGTQKGGSSGSGGVSQSGGSQGSGGVSQTGGSPANGGAQGTGGSQDSGGKQSSGGATGSGGATNKGGSIGKDAGIATGGNTSMTGGNSGKQDGAAGSDGPATGTWGTSAGGQVTGGQGGGTSIDGGLAGTTGTFVENDGTDCTVGAMPTPTANAKLPNPFKKLDGTIMTTKAEWHCRRQEILKMAEAFAYGTKEGTPTTTGTVTDGKITVNVSQGGKTASFSVSWTKPSTGTAPYPAIIGLSSMVGIDTSIVSSEGVAFVTYDPYAIGAEGTGRSSKSGVYYTINGSTSKTGLLMAWGWGVSRIIDVIAQSDGKLLKADAIGVTGCSRFGKGAFVIGVMDQRVALPIPMESGSAGVPIWRGIPGEGAQSLSSAYGEQPWFGDAFSAFTSDPTKAPLDTHEVVAMVAPRGLLILDNPSIANLGPKSAHVAALGGAEVYKALGYADRISYHSDTSNGNHCSVRTEYAQPLKDNIERYLLKTGTTAGVIKAASSATGKLSDWSDWTTPTLN